MELPMACWPPSPRRPVHILLLETITRVHAYNPPPGRPLQDASIESAISVLACNNRSLAYCGRRSCGLGSIHWIV